MNASIMPSTRDAKILVVDDDTINLKLYSRILEDEGYECIRADSGGDALNKVISYSPDLILLDIMMPGIDGFEVAKKLKNSLKTSTTPIIMVTALTDQKSKERGLAIGVEDFLHKPVIANELQIKVRNMLRLKMAIDMLKIHKKDLEQTVEKRSQELKESFEEEISVLMVAAGYKDDEPDDHVRRTSLFTKELSEQMGMRREFSQMIFRSSALHDLGKIGVPDHILSKPGSLLPEEVIIMREHTIIGEKILRPGTSPYIKMGREIALSHHERWDGSGYPHRLKGDQIPISARIMNICDIYDALRSRRPHKEPFDHAKAMEIIRKGDGRVMPRHFDPDIREAFIRAADKMEEIFVTDINALKIET